MLSSQCWCLVLNRAAHRSDPSEAGQEKEGEDSGRSAGGEAAVPAATVAVPALPIDDAARAVLRCRRTAMRRAKRRRIKERRKLENVLGMNLMGMDFEEFQRQGMDPKTFAELGIDYDALLTGLPKELENPS
ncbi:hypothetical protein COCON_G00225020 [Conger conger]|uniref:Uncharacterized protein n=1 Tax=Conger conger TaxID=82655 RepID=A0A9Q1CVZ2_CONCO|nr:hypothetical protein COCON_G00225020 [Conger conger]